MDKSRDKESRHLWVGGLPDDVDEGNIKDYFSRYGKVEGVKILPQKYPNIGLAAFVDFCDVKGAIEAKESKLKWNGNELRANFKFDKSEGMKSHDRERHESGSSSSDSDSGSSSSSSSSDSDTSKRKKKASSSTAANPGALFIKASGLANRSERVLQDGLYYEFCRFSTDVVVKMYTKSDKKWAIIKYKRPDRCREAFSQCQGMMLYGSKIKLSLMEVDDFPPGGRDQGQPGGSHPGGEYGSRLNMLEDLDPKATRSLFVGNIPKHINVYDLRDSFIRYGTVLDVEIKKMGGSATYGFILYYDLLSAVTAKHYMDGHNIKGNMLRVGFGKGTASKQVWLDGIDPGVSESQLERQLSKYGKVMRIGIDRYRCCAMVQYDTMEAAKEALNAVRGTIIGNSRKLMTDFANRDAKAAFFSHMDAMEAGTSGPFPSRQGHMYDMHGGRGGMMGSGGPGGMVMGRGGYGPPHGHAHPMDYFYHPGGYGMDYYGGGRPPYGPPGGPPGHYPPGPYGRDNDYDDELRAFSRKRELEKRIGVVMKKKKYSSSSDSGDDSSGGNGQKGNGEDDDMEDVEEKSKRKGRTDRAKKRGRKGEGSPKEKAGGSKSESSLKGKAGGRKADANSDSEDQEEGSRIRATRKSRDLREKLKMKALAKKAADSSSEEEDGSDDGKSSRRDMEMESPVRAKQKQEEIVEIVDSKDVFVKPLKLRRSSSSTPERVPARKPPPLVKKKQSEGESEEETKVLVRKRSHQSLRDKDQRSEEGSSPHHKAKRASEYIHKGARNGVLSEEPSSPRHRKGRRTGMDGDGDRAESSDEGSRSSRHRLRGESSKTRLSRRKLEESSQVPPVISFSRSNPSPRPPAVGSDLSSGEDFREVGHGHQARSSERRRVGNKKRISDNEGGDSRRRADSSPAKPRRRPQTPDYPTEDADWKGSGHPKTPPLSDKPDFSDMEEGRSSRGMRDSSKTGRDSSKTGRKVPRRYQGESGGEVMAGGSGRREGSSRYRESKEGHQERRFHGSGPQGSSPSPPPHMGRKKFHHSPPPPQGGAENFERRRRRGRGYSPGPPGGGGGSGGGARSGGFQRRRSPGFQSPPFMMKSPYGGGSPPHSREKSPIPRARAGRYGRFDNSPPFDNQQRQKLNANRGRGSPSPSHHRYPHSPSPPPRNAPRSPHGRRFQRRRSGSSVSPPRMPRVRRDRSSPGLEFPHTPPREEHFEPPGKRHKRPHSPAPPSPKDSKYRSTGKDSDYPEVKRRRIEESRPKSPSISPPSLRDSAKEPPARNSRQQAHLGGQLAAEQRGGSKAGAAAAAAAVGSLQRQQVPPPISVPAEPSKPSAVSSSLRPPSQSAKTQGASAQPQDNSLINLLRRYPVMWQGHLMLKNDAAAVQLHFLSGNLQLAQGSLPSQGEQHTPVLRIAQRMRLEKTQLEGVDRRIQVEKEHCLLLALPCGKDAGDVVTQTNALQANLINYLLQKQAAGIINVQTPQSRGGYVLHIFPPCSFSQSHLSRVAPDLLSTATDNCHLMIVVATM